MSSVDLADVRPCLEGAIPAIMATTAADGTPNVAYISQVYYVDQDHVALSFQFFNKTRQNLLSHPRSTLLVLNPLDAVFYRLHLRYLRTETEGPVFESMKAQLAGIASHTGMAEVFRLLGSDIHEVVELERLPQEPLTEALPAPPPRPNPLVVLRRGSARLSAARSLGAALEATLDTLEQELGVRHAMLLILDAATQRLYTVASRGYATSGVGSEIALGDGVIGVAARERTPVRIGHMTSAYRYSRAMRDSLMGDGSAVASTDIPYPGLSEPHSQLAVPLLSADRVIGVLFVESPVDMQFSYEDEDLMVALGGQLGAVIDLMQEAEAPCTTEEVESATASVPPPRPVGPALRVRHYRSNDSVFVNNTYLIKGVAGAILWKLLQDRQLQGRNEFTNRELRLDASLRLPDVADNLEARLLLLHRRLAEQCPQLRIQKTGRGCFRFEALGPVELEDVAALGARASASHQAGHRGQGQAPGELAPVVCVEQPPRGLGHALEHRRRRAGAHALHHAQAFRGAQVRQHPAHHQHHLGRRHGRHQGVVHGDQFDVGVSRPQCGVVHRFLGVHVLQVVGHEHGQRQVQGLQPGFAFDRLAAGQGLGGIAQVGDVVQVAIVLLRHGGRDARAARVQRGVHEAVLVRHMVDAQRHQFVHLRHGVRHFRVVGGVGATDHEQRVGHEGAQGLVDAGIEVEAAKAGAGGGGDVRHFEGVGLHDRVSFGGRGPTCLVVTAAPHVQRIMGNESRNPRRRAPLNSA